MFDLIRLKSLGSSLILLFPLALLPIISCWFYLQNTRSSHHSPATSVQALLLLSPGLSQELPDCFLFGSQTDPMKTYTQIMSSSAQNSPKGLHFSQRSQTAPTHLQGPDLLSLDLMGLVSTTLAFIPQQPPQPSCSSVNKPGRADLTGPVLPVPAPEMLLPQVSSSSILISFNSLLKYYFLNRASFITFLYKKMPKNWCFWIVVREKILESPLDSKEIKPVNPKRNQPWMLNGKTNAEAEVHKQMTHLKRPWCSEGLKVKGEEGSRGWDGWIVSPIQWTWTWANSRR